MVLPAACKVLLCHEVGFRIRVAADLHGMWQNEKDYTNVVKGFGVEEAFPEFIARKGRP